MRRLLLGLFLLLPACADFFGTKDAHQPGTALGTFHVTATRTANTCGEGALGTQPAWAFDVKLARDTGVVFWNNGQEQISGVLDADQVTFSFDTGILIDMRTDPSHGLPACSISRHDQAAGVLGAPTGDVASFTGTLAFDFAPSAGSQCQDLVDGPSPILAALPCGFAYKLAGTRTAAPTP